MLNDTKFSIVQIKMIMIMLKSRSSNYHFHFRSNLDISFLIFWFVRHSFFFSLGSRFMLFFFRSSVFSRFLLFLVFLLHLFTLLLHLLPSFFVHLFFCLYFLFCQRFLLRFFSPIFSRHFFTLKVTIILFIFVLLSSFIIFFDLMSFASVWRLLTLHLLVS